MKNAAKAGIFGGIMLAVGAAAGYGIARLVDVITIKRAIKRGEITEIDVCDCGCDCDCDCDCENCEATDVVDEAEAPAEEIVTEA